jgi:3',5'-cyclic AMP phosphodiesterase CpdA
MSGQVFRPGQVRDSTRDVRDLTGLADLVADGEPHGPLWPLLAARRAGKTWALKCLHDQLAGRQRHAAYINLRDDDLHEQNADKAVPDCLLLDEPVTQLSGPEQAKTFLKTCKELRARGTRLVLAVSPRECAALFEYGAGAVERKDFRFLGPLTAQEQDTLASRAGWAAQLLPSLPEQWRRHPFLLELALSVAENDRRLLADHRTLLRGAIDTATDQFQHNYIEDVFETGLNKEQRDLMRRVARGNPVVQAVGPLVQHLVVCGLLDRQGDKLTVADPVLAAHLPPPLRIHHISDIHIGPKSHDPVDSKAAGSVGAALAAAAGAGPGRDDYLVHLEELEKSGHAPHLLVVSGDLVEYGADRVLFQTARAWVERAQRMLADHPDLRPGDARVLLVGGNHDVDWQVIANNADNDPQARHRPFAEAFAGYPRPQLELPPDQRPAHSVEYLDAGIAFLLLGSAELGGEVEHSDDWSFVLDELTKRRKAIDAARSEAKSTQATQLLERLGRVDPGLVHDHDLKAARKHPWKADVRIAVLHHHISPMPNVEIAPYAGLVNAGAVKDMLLSKQFCLVLHGHQHSGWFGLETWPTNHGDWCLRIAAAPSLASREVTERHGFNEVIVRREGSEIYEVTVRRYVRKGNSWGREAEMGPFIPGQA